MSLTRTELAELDGIPRDELAAAQYEVTLGELDITDDLAECTYGGADGRAWTFSATVNQEIEDTYEQAWVRVRYYVRGKRYLAFKGKAITVSARGGITTIEAATGSYEAERVPIGDGNEEFDVEADDWDINDERPDAVLFTAALMLPYDDIDIRPIEVPPISKRQADGNAVKWYEYVESVFGIVEEAAQIRVVDDSVNVMHTMRNRPPRTDIASVWHIESGNIVGFPDSDEISDETLTGSGEGERYARVIVRDSTGRRVGFARVDNGMRRVHPRSTLFVDLPEGAEDSGQQLATDTAEFVGTNARTIAADTLYPPFMLQRGMMTHALARTWSPGIQYERTFQFQLSTINVDVKGRKGAIGGVGRKTKSTVTPIEVTLPTLPSAARPYYGLMPDGTPYFNTTLPWVRDTGAAIALDPDIAAQYGILITVDGDVVSVARGTAAAEVTVTTTGELLDTTTGEMLDTTIGELT